MNYHLAIDIGASSGRHILGYIENGILKEEEVYRFDNNIVKSGSSLIWDIDALNEHVKIGIRRCREIGKIPSTVAIDTWGVDYVLLDSDYKELLPVYCYRDSRTLPVIPKTEKLIPFSTLYSITGIQKQPFNTVYQLYCDKQSGKLKKASHFLMMPAYLSYKLTGIIKNEYTDASTTSMVNANTKDWDFDIIDTLGYPKFLFTDLCLPGSSVGEFTKEIEEYCGFNSTVVFCPSHDTASAVAACPTNIDSAYISSGTWSLIGTENSEPILSAGAREANFANEGGAEYRFRFLKNYMGMWLFQNIRKDINKSMSYDEMMNLAMDSKSVEYIDVNAREFVAPENMTEAIRKYLGKPDMPLGDVLNCVYHSLARSYKYAIEEIEKLCNKKINAIHIVGGGCRDKYLNKLTAEYTSLSVTAGPIEATSCGNLIAQLIFSGECKDIDNARELIKASFEIV